MKLARILLSVLFVVVLSIGLTTQALREARGVGGRLGKPGLWYLLAGILFIVVVVLTITSPGSD